MTLPIRIAALALLAFTAAPATAQTRTIPPVTLPPEPLPMGVPYVYQPGNPYWFRPVVQSPSYYPFGSTNPIFGRYSWDYGAYPPAGYGWYQANVVAFSYPYPAYSVPPYTSYSPYPYSYYYPTLPARVWMGYGW